MRGRNTLGAVGIAVLLATAGCMGFLSGGGGTPTPTATETATPAQTTVAPTATATETATKTATKTPTATATKTPYVPVYESPLDGATILDRHRKALRSAGNFSVESSLLRVVPVGDGREPFRRVQNESARVDLESGQVRGWSNRTGFTWAAYRTGEGTVYNRLNTTSRGVGYGKGQQGLARPGRHLSLPTPGQGQEATPILAFVDNASLQFHHKVETDGRRVDVYLANGSSAVTGTFYERLGVPPERVSDLRVRVAIDQRGIVHEAKLSAKVNLDAGTGRVVASVRYSGVGSTTVAEPLWLDAAKKAIEGRDPDVGEVVTVSTTKPNLGVSATVTAPYQEGGIDPTIILVQGSPASRDPVRAAQVMPAFRIDTPKDARSGKVTFEYDDRDVPEGDERNLIVRRYDPNQDRFVAVNTSVNVAVNRVTAELDPRGGVYVLVHDPTYREETGAVVPRVVRSEG